MTRLPWYRLVIMALLLLNVQSRADTILKDSVPIMKLEPSRQVMDAIDPVLLKLLYDNEPQNDDVVPIYQRWSPAALEMHGDTARYEHGMARHIVADQRQAVEDDRDFMAAITALMDMESRMESSLAKATIFAAIGEFYYRMNDYLSAEKYMRQAIEIEPGDASAGIANNVAASFLMRYEIEQAEDILDAIPLEFVRSPNVLYGVWFNKACIFSLRDDAKNAVLYLQRAALVQPDLVIANMGDPQLDKIRDHEMFRLFKMELESMVTPVEGRDMQDTLTVLTVNDSIYDGFSLKQESAEPGEQLVFPALRSIEGRSPIKGPD